MGQYSDNLSHPHSLARALGRVVMQHLQQCNNATLQQCNTRPAAPSAADTTNWLHSSAIRVRPNRTSRLASPFPPEYLISPPGCRIFALDSKVGEQLFEARRASVRWHENLRRKRLPLWLPRGGGYRKVKRLKEKYHGRAT